MKIKRRYKAPKLRRKPYKDNDISKVFVRIISTQITEDTKLFYWQLIIKGEVACISFKDFVNPEEAYKDARKSFKYRPRIDDSKVYVYDSRNMNVGGKIA